MKVPIYNTKNEEVGKAELSDAVFGVEWNPDLVHQVLAVKASNRHQPWAHAKSRAAVSGGGKKPWRQKGTGRARHGSTRSPIWKGGGVTFGPTNERNYEKKINKKMVRAALHSSLSQKLRDTEVKVINSLQLADFKTKNLHNVLKNLQTLNALVVPAAGNKNIFRACANIPKTKCLAAAALNVTDVLKYKNILIDQEALKDIR